MKAAKQILDDLIKGLKVSRWIVSANITELRELLEENKYKHLEEEIEWLFDCCHY